MFSIWNKLIPHHDRRFAGKHAVPNVYLDTVMSRTEKGRLNRPMLISALYTFFITKPISFGISLEKGEQHKLREHTHKFHSIHWDGLDLRGAVHPLQLTMLTLDI